MTPGLVEITPGFIVHALVSFITGFVTAAEETGLTFSIYAARTVTFLSVSRE